MEWKRSNFNRIAKKNLQIVSESAEFANLEREWNALAGARQTPLHSFEWFDACRQAKDDKCDLLVFVSRVDGVARAIAPLVVDRSGVIPILRSLDHFTCEVNHFIYSDDSALAPVCAGILEAGLPLRLPKVRIDRAEMQCLRSASGGKGLMVERNADSLNYVPLEPEWSALEQKMSSSRRWRLRSCRRKAERSGRVRFDAVSPDAISVDGHLEELFRVEGASWKAKAGTAMIKDSRMRRHITAFARAAARLGTLRMFFLRIGDATAAAQMTSEHGGRLWCLKIGYDERWAKSSPGLLLMNETLRYACERGLKSYEHLGTAEPWHHHWPIKTHACGSIRYYPPSISGGIRILHDAGKLMGLRSRRALSYLHARLPRPH